MIHQKIKKQKNKKIENFYWFFFAFYFFSVTGKILMLRKRRVTRGTGTIFQRNSAWRWNFNYWICIALLANCCRCWCNVLMLLLIVIVSGSLIKKKYFPNYSIFSTLKEYKNNTINSKKGKNNKKCDFKPWIGLERIKILLLCFFKIYFSLKIKISQNSLFFYWQYNF